MVDTAPDLVTAILAMDARLKMRSLPLTRHPRNSVGVAMVVVPTTETVTTVTTSKITSFHHFFYHF